jgi:hypothetical protein
MQRRLENQWFGGGGGDRNVASSRNFRVQSLDDVRPFGHYTGVELLGRGSGRVHERASGGIVLLLTFSQRNWRWIMAHDWWQRVPLHRGKAIIYFRPQLELLESRMAPAVLTWSGMTDGLWSNPANWDAGRAPRQRGRARFPGLCRPSAE